MFVILRGAHARFERGGRPASADDTCCPSASAEILRGSCALFGRPSHVPRDCPKPQVQASSPGGGTCAGSLVESGSVGTSPGALGHTLLRIFSPLCAGRTPNPSLRGKVGALRRSLLRQMPDALTGGGLACAAFAFGALPVAGAARPSCRARIPAHRRAFACERREAAFPAMFRRRHGVAVLPRRAPRIFLRFRQDGGKSCGGERGGAPARSRKRAECGRPGLPHSG